MKMRNIIIIISLCLTSCMNGQKQNPTEKVKDLNLHYEILSMKNQFPNDSLIYNSGFLIVDIPAGARYIDIAESIKVIGLKENMCSAKIFTTKTGYLMEIDSISRNFSEYYESFLGYYDVTTKGLNWKFTFDANDIHFKGSLPVKIQVN